MTDFPCTEIKIYSGADYARLEVLTREMTDIINKHCPGDANMATNALFIMAAQIALQQQEAKDDYKVVRGFRQMLEQARARADAEKRKSMQ